MKPYVWKGELGAYWYMSKGKTPMAIFHARAFDTWQHAMDAAHTLIAHEPS